MFIGLGLGINTIRGGGTAASAFYNRWADSNGGAVFSFEDDSVFIRDPVTPSNNYSGSAITYFKTVGSYSGTRKWTPNASGIYVQNASGDLPYTWSSTGAALGYLPEEARTNIALWNRDLTNAAWTKSNATAALTQTGIDGTANSASLLTATAGNATCLQTVTLASSQRFQTAFVRRITGSGTINMTTDGGTTWTAVTVTSSWTRVEIPAQTVTNPQFGFRIVTSGDAIAIDGVQNETGAFGTSVMFTTSAAVTRTADNASVATSVLPYSATANTLFGKAWNRVATGGFNVFASVWSAGNNNIQLLNRSPGTTALRAAYTVSAVPQAEFNALTGAPSLATAHKIAIASNTNDFAASGDGQTTQTDGAGALFTPTTVSFGNLTSSANYLNGELSMLAMFPRRISNADLQTMTA